MVYFRGPQKIFMPFFSLSFLCPIPRQLLTYFFVTIEWFAFSGILYKLNHVCFWLFSLIVMILGFSEIAIISLFIFIDNNPLYGYITFWLSSHLLKGILVTHYPHFKDEQIEAKKGNLAQRHTTRKWQRQDLEGSCGHHCTTQHSADQDLNTDLDPSPCSWPLGCNKWYDPPRGGR